MRLALASFVFFRKTLICTSQFEARSRSRSWWGISAERAVASAAFEIDAKHMGENVQPEDHRRSVMITSVSASNSGVANGLGPPYGASGGNRAWMLASGVVEIALGVVGIVVLFSLAIIDVKYIGVLLLTAGSAQAAVALLCKGWKGERWHIAIAAAYAIGGTAILWDPLLSSEITTFVAAGVLLSAGSARMVMARQVRGRLGPGWILFAGLAALPLGVIILSEGPLYSLFSVALFISLELLLQGTSCLMIAAAARKLTGAVAA
jgi:uncharacterized membrane protein HdeD (DUF308 family)